MTSELTSLSLSVAMSVAAGLVGCFVIMRRMALAADALSHVALPGIGIALAIGLNPLVGAAAMLFFGALLVWGLEQRTRIATETIIGVVFSAALALGSLMSSGEGLIEALFGGSGAVSLGETVFGLVAAVTVTLFILGQKSRLVLTLVSREIGRTAGINVARLDLLFLETFALTVALGLRYLGVLLMGSLIIIPAATAKRLSRTFNGMMACSVAVSVLATTLGTLAADVLHRPTGPVIISVGTLLFVLSLAFRATVLNPREARRREAHARRGHPFARRRRQLEPHVVFELAPARPSTAPDTQLPSDRHPSPTTAPATAEASPTERGT